MTQEQYHLEFSFLLATTNFGDSVRIGINPFTGESTEFPVDPGLTEEEIEAVEDVFARNGIRGPEPEGEGYAVYGEGGESLRFRCHDLDGSLPVTGIAVELVVPQLSDGILEIILEVARAGNLVLTSSTGEGVRIVDLAPKSEMKDRWPDIQTISSVSELFSWLEDTIGGARCMLIDKQFALARSDK